MRIRTLPSGVAQTGNPRSPGVNIVFHNEEELLHWWRSQPEIDELNTLIDLPAVWTPAETPWLSTLSAAISDVPVPYFTDGSYIAQALPGVPITVWGPGSPSAMHAINERVSLSDLELAIQMFATAVSSWPDGSGSR